MKKYRLKKEAVKFFLDKHATSIYELDTWESLGVDIIALDEVEDIYLRYGHWKDEGSGTLSGWNEKGSHFEFTIYFPSVKHCEHDKFNKGKITRELMNKIQRQIDCHYDDFVNEYD